MSPPETNRRCSRGSSAGGCAVVCVIAVLLTTSGCNLLNKLNKPPRTIAVRDETVPHFIDKGEPAPFDGVIMSRPLFIEFAPCFEDAEWTPREKTQDAKESKPVEPVIRPQSDP